MRAPPAWHLGDVMTKQMYRTGIRGQFSCNQVEKRGLSGAIGSDDQPALARFYIEVDAVRDAQAAERFAQSGNSQRAHGFAPAPLGTLPVSLWRLRQIIRHKRALPGTSPSGIKMTIATKIAPSRKFQRSMKPLTTVFTTTTRVAPTIGPNSVPAPPEITISSTSAEAVRASVCGLMNCV